MDIDSATVPRRIALTAAHGAILVFVAQEAVRASELGTLDYRHTFGAGVLAAILFLGSCLGYGSLVFKGRTAGILETLSALVLIGLFGTIIFAMISVGARAF